MRSRNVKPGFFTNFELGELHPLGRLLFIGLWCIADREGRLYHRPKQIKAEILPYDNVSIDALLDDLEQKKFITIYERRKHKYIAISNFHKHQHPHIKESQSTIPAPCKTRNARNEHRAKTPDSLLLIPDSLLPESGVVPFQDFYDLYPKKKAVADAEKAWKKAFVEGVLTKQVWEERARPALLIQRETVDWKKDEGQFVPFPATWIRRRRWEDEIEAQAEVVG